MEPALNHGQIVIGSSLPFLFKKPEIGDIVVLAHGRCIIKRIVKIEKDKIFIMGDNKKESTDSRSFGWINKQEILGKVMFKF